MKIRALFLLVLCAVIGAVPVFAQAPVVKLVVGTTQLASGQIKLGERLTTSDGTALDPGVYRATVSLGTTGETIFLLTPLKGGPPQSGIEKNAVNQVRTDDPGVLITARVTKNMLVKGIASNLEGFFSLSTITPTETRLTFSSKQFDADAVLGRSPDSKMADLVPIFVGLEQPSSCGDSCIEGFVKVIVRNDGNAPASGKWNVTIMDPQLYVGTIADLAPTVEKAIVSTTKIKLACCGAAQLEAEVHADFYNKDSADSNESNNVKKFSVNLKQ